MSKQEEIREGMMAFLCEEDNRKAGDCFEYSSHPNCLYYVEGRGCDKVYGILWFLHSQGVVVERELPDEGLYLPGDFRHPNWLTKAELKAIIDLAVEPLIGGK